MDASEISCACGSIGVTLSGAPLVQFYCHCDDCQIVHGAAYVPVFLYRADAVRLTRGTPKTWALRTSVRTTCGECGTRLCAAPAGPPIRGVTAYFVRDRPFEPEFHIYCDFARLPVRDDLPHYRRLPARLGGSDETVDW